MITEARERSTGMVHEAQQRKQQILEELAAERTQLEQKIDELRTFERDYRSRLKAFIGGQLSELEDMAVDSGAHAEEGEEVSAS